MLVVYRDSDRLFSHEKMFTMASLYRFCTLLGTAIFILLFLNYYLDSTPEEEIPEEEIEKEKNTKSKTKPKHTNRRSAS